MVMPHIQLPFLDTRMHDPISLFCATQNVPKPGIKLKQQNKNILRSASAYNILLLIAYSMKGRFICRFFRRSHITKQLQIAMNM